MPPTEVERMALPLLVEFDVGVNCALTQDRLDDANATSLKRMKEAGVSVGFWPLLPVEEGYFPNELNAPLFSSYVEEILAWSSSHGFLPDRLAFDMEPPIDAMVALTGSTPSRAAGVFARMLKENSDRARYEEAKAVLSREVERVKARGILVEAAVMPWVALELYFGGEGAQDLSETPVAGIGWDSISPMWYSSMIEGLTGGRVTERDADWLLYQGSVMLRSRVGKAASVSVGITGSGILGEERVFSSVEGLLAGVRAALAAGIETVTVYNLEGIVGRSDAREWLSALASARPGVPPRTSKATRILNIAGAIIPALNIR